MAKLTSPVAKAVARELVKIFVTLAALVKVTCTGVTDVLDDSKISDICA